MKTFLRNIHWLIIIVVAMAAVAWLSVADGGVVVRMGNTERHINLAWALILFTVLTLLAAFVFIGLGWLSGMPARVRATSEARRRERGLQALRRGFVAAAVGDAIEAQRQSRRASQYLTDEPVLTGLLAAQAAESSGDRALAEQSYTALLDHPETRLLARRGLTETALDRGDDRLASQQADAAFKDSGKAEWAFDAAFDLKLQHHDWRGALDTLDEADRRGMLSGDRMRRRRAVLYTALAHEAENKGDLGAALERAEKAAKLAPGFAPAAVMAARLFNASQKGWRAASILERAWERAPHPAIAGAYRDLKKDEPLDARIKRMQNLARLNKEHRESQILEAELSLLEGKPAEAYARLQPLVAASASSRLCVIMSKVCAERSDPIGEREWMERASSAPPELNWTDFSPDGRAFDYRGEDWARLVHVYGDTASLIHPRHERSEASLAPMASAGLLAAPERSSRAADGAMRQVGGQIGGQAGAGAFPPARSPLGGRQPMTPAQAFEASAAAERLQFEDEEFESASQSTPSPFAAASRGVARAAGKLASRARVLADKLRR